MWCLTSFVGMGTLVELEDRSPTSQESSAIRNCSSDTREIAAWNAEWPKRIDAALTPSACGAAPVTNFPSSYYQGPLIDSHLHIPQLSDDGLGGPDDGYVAPRGAESDLYDTLSQEQRTILGLTMNIDRIACTLQNEGSTKAFAFFPVFPEITSPAIEVAYKAVEKYPGLFVPFIQASRGGMATLEGPVLVAMVSLLPGLFAGFGEVGDSPTESINPKPDSEIYTGDFQVISDHGNMLVYFHPGMGHQDNLERALQQFSDVTFIIHADFVRPHVQGIMDRNPNVYYTYNDIFGDLIETFRFGEKDTFQSDMRSEWDRLLEEADALYRPMIEAHPDRFMWGTDRGDIVWGYDEEVGQILAEFARAFIGRFDPAIQADLAYNNAERLIALTTGS
jgi:predicted TIM-barrel fold metal-dependent hydrolase